MALEMKPFWETRTDLRRPLQTFVIPMFQSGKGCCFIAKSGTNLIDALFDRCCFYNRRQNS